MPLTFEVLFVDKIVGSDRRGTVEWLSLSPDPDFNKIVNDARSKICKFLDCESDDLVFRSIRVC